MLEVIDVAVELLYEMKKALENVSSSTFAFAAPLNAQAVRNLGCSNMERAMKANTWFEFNR